MKFTDMCPSTWKELQDYVALFLNEAGYHAVSPCTIETARGHVEVDVLVESPDELIKKIICECKYWNSPIPKEKVHAFRSIVSDSGASLGMVISKSGFQSGAIETAKYSNVKLITWEEFIELISNKWIISQLRKIKKDSVPLSVYMNPFHFPYDKLEKKDVKRYLAACDKYGDLRRTCWMITKNDLEKDFKPAIGWYHMEEFASISSYISFLSNQVAVALHEFGEILESSRIEIPKERFEKLEGYIYMFLS